MSPKAENALDDTRLEWTEEPEPGVVPTDPSWRRFSPEMQTISVSLDGSKEATDTVGTRDVVEMYRGTEEAELTLGYSQYRFPVNSAGVVQDPIAYPLLRPSGEWPSLTIVSRQDVTEGGRTGAGYREYLVVRGARPTGSTLDGDPSASEPIPQELTLPAARGRPHIIHQPASEEGLVIRSTSPDDTNEVVIESEGGTTTETVALPGADPNTAATSATFPGVDVLWVRGEHAGDIQVGTNDGEDAIQTPLLEKPLTGTDTDGVDSVAGVPPLGSGSHGDPVTGEGTMFLGTQASFAGEPVGTRLHTLNLTAEVETSREPVQGSREEEIDVGAASAEFDADLAGPYESAAKIKAHFRDLSGDLVFGFANDPSTDPVDAPKRIVTHDVEIVDAPDFTREAGETNYIPSVTFRATGDPAIEIINNA